MKLSLASAAVQGDNAGDALIEDAIRRLVIADKYERVPLLKSLTEEDFQAINSSDALIICGTNLYQRVFNCNLTIDTINKIKVPIIPMGIGSSASIGEIPVMSPEGVRAVRALHKRCSFSSVRDEASLRFLHSIGVRNTIMTGCPVLFHALRRPDFKHSGKGFTLTPRARLLHIDDYWNARQLETLDILCQRYNPTLVLQSPYDIPISEELVKRHNIDVLYDDEWQADVYVRKAIEQEMSFGFRLHFGMLSLSYGKPTFFIAHDSRVSEFCELVGIPYFDIKNYSDNSLLLQIDACSFNAESFMMRWTELAQEMNRFLKANGLSSRLDVGAMNKSHHTVQSNKSKKRILMLVDQRGWAFDNSARQIADLLRDDFRFDIRYVQDSPNINASNYDLLYVFYWGESYYKKFGFDSDNVIKELSSHRWEGGDPRVEQCTAGELVEKYLSDAGTILCTSLRLRDSISGFHPRVYHTPNGFDSKRFYYSHKRVGQMTIGWAGNIDDPVKGIKEILQPACQGRFKLLLASGDISGQKMNDFYNRLDVFAVASKNEGEPLTLIEAMAAGCFPVCTDVGIVPELIKPYKNGLIVTERSPEAFQRAFEWCESHLEQIRKAGEMNADLMRRERSWEVTAPFFKRAFTDALEYAQRHRFRNDDVSWDTPLVSFIRFCSIFQKYGLIQIHGITLRGRTSTIFTNVTEPVEYEGVENISHLSNPRIKELSEGMRFEDRTDLIEFLKNGPDEIALHGLYHTDYSKMTAEEQRQEIEEGLSILKDLFPYKPVKYFIPPFNRTNEDTFNICKDLKLNVISAEGMHLEAELNDLAIRPESWYRYHHHRFYPESTFRYYKLSFEGLDNALSRNFNILPRDKKLYPIEKKDSMITKTINSLAGFSKNLSNKLL